MSEVLTIEEITARAAAVAEEREAETPVASRPRRWIRTLDTAADDLIEQATNPDGRFMFGIERLDLMIRGIGAGELAYFTGRAHSGKTQLLLNAVVNNPNSRVLWITPDEVAELVLMKLVTMVERIAPERLEELIRGEDATTLAMVRAVAREKFPNLLVVDQTPTVDGMTVALTEATDYWDGETADLVVVDFLELLATDGDAQGVSSTSKALKAWGKQQGVPLAVVHQSSRSGGKRGQASGMDGMRYGGETEAIYVIEAYRKRDDDTKDQYEIDQQQNTISVNVAKNKRPPCHTGEVDLFMHPTYGYIREMTEGDEGTPMLHTRAPRGGDRESQADVMARVLQERNG